MRYERECLYDVEWQRIRVEMLGTWDTLPKAKINVYVLRRYLEADGPTLYERALRCSNYMAAIMLGYGNREQFAECYAFVSSAQKMFAGYAAAVNLARASPHSMLVWDWAKVRNDLLGAKADFLKACNDNLKKRIYTSTKRTGGTQHRPELMKFIGMLQNEMITRGMKT